MMRSAACEVCFTESNHERDYKQNSAGHYDIVLREEYSVWDG